MEPFGVVLLVASVLVVCGAAVEIALGILLWWTVSHLESPTNLEARVMRLDALCSALESQVNKLRTSKAGRISNAKRAAEAEPEEVGIDAEEQALFREIGLQ